MVATYEYTFCSYTFEVDDSVATDDMNKMAEVGWRVVNFHYFDGVNDAGKYEKWIQVLYERLKGEGRE